MLIAAEVANDTENRSFEEIPAEVFRGRLRQSQSGTADVNSYGPQEPCLPPAITRCGLLPSAFIIHIPLGWAIEVHERNVVRLMP